VATWGTCIFRHQRPRARDLTLLTLVPAKKNQDISTGAFVDSSKLDAARVFLDSLAGFVSTYSNGVQIDNQQEVLRKAQKKMGQLKNDSVDYETRLRDLQSDLAQNKADQVKASADLQNYIGADSDKKQKYQRRLNKLLDKQASLEKKIRNTQSDLAETRSDLIRQQTLIDQSQTTLEAFKQRRP
jgi:chromosome segregation ATPase